MDPASEAQQRRERDMEVVRREVYRKSRDIIRIYNPLDRDFTFKYDGYPHVVKAKTSKDVERYLARHYFKKIADFMIGELARARGDKMIEEHLGRGQGGYIDKFVENTEVWDKVPTQNDEEYLKIVAAQTILGLVSEYGLEFTDQEQEPKNKPFDMRSMHEQVVDLFDNKLVVEEPIDPEVLPIKEKIEL